MSGSRDTLLKKATIAETAGNYALAMELYLAGTSGHSGETCFHQGSTFYNRLQTLGKLQTETGCAATYELLRDCFSSGPVGRAFSGARLAVAYYPRSYEIWELLGLACYQAGRHPESVQAFQTAVSLRPESAAAHSNLGVARRACADYSGAIQSYRESLKLKADDAEVLTNLGVALEANGEAESAILVYKAALKIDPDNFKAHNNLGNSLRENKNPAAALHHYERATSLQPSHYDSYLNLAIVLHDLGQLGLAASHYQRVLDLKPGHPSAIRCLSGISSFDASDEFLDQALACWHSKSASDEERCEVGFGIYNIFRRRKEYEKGFFYLKEANKLRREKIKFNFEKTQKNFLELRSKAASWASARMPKPNDDFCPIFIFGLPRSGTTLVEQIISGHSNVNGLGELPFIEQKIARMDLMSTDATANVRSLREDYAARVVERHSGSRHTTDKMPHNFLYLPLLVAAFPAAKFIHVYRNPAATLWSSYERYFPSKLNYVYDLGDLRRYYDLYRELMMDYANVLGPKMYDVDYEALTERPDREIPALMDHVGLELGDLVMAPHLNPRSVATHSNEQVRSPIYAGSSENWRVFEPFLKGALDGIEAYRTNETLETERS